MEKFKREKEREEIEKFEKTKNIVWESIGYEFQNSKLLMEAVSHTKSSYLCTIGDSVLDLVITDFISFELLEVVTPEEIAENRSILINNGTLSRLCIETGLFKALTNMDPGLQKDIDKYAEDVFSGSKKIPKKSALADFVERMIGAIFVDTGRNFENSKKIIIDGFYDGKIKNILEKHQTDMNSNLEHHFKKTL